MIDNKKTDKQKPTSWPWNLAAAKRAEQSTIITDKGTAKLRKRNTWNRKADRINAYVSSRLTEDVLAGYRNTPATAKTKWRCTDSITEAYWVAFWTVTECLAPWVRKTNKQTTTKNMNRLQNGHSFMAFMVHRGGAIKGANEVPAQGSRGPPVLVLGTLSWFWQVIWGATYQCSAQGPCVQLFHHWYCTL